MRKLFSFIVGIGLGAALAVVLVALFAPKTGEAFRAQVRQHAQNALEAARQASAAKRAELEAELQRPRPNA